MKKHYYKSMISAAMALAVIPGMASASLTWYVNYVDSQSALGYGTATQTKSRLTDEYKYTAESVVAFHDNDSSGGISAGDTFDDYVGFVIDGLNLGGSNTFDPDYQLGNVQLTGTLVASGYQATANDYVVTSATLEFYYDSPTATLAGGTAGVYSDFNTLVDGVLVQTGTGSGVGSNSTLAPDGNINLSFSLTDVLSTLDPSYGPLEQFAPVSIDLDQITFYTDSNSNLCAAGASCGGSLAGIASFFGVDLTTYDFAFHTRSDGSASKIPEPGSLVLLGVGLIGMGLARGKFRKA